MISRFQNDASATRNSVLTTAEPESPPCYKVGTLIYSRAGLIALFGWLLWGDFILNLMEQVMPSLLPLLLKSHNASNQEIAIIINTLGMTVNAVLNPIISYKSDRCRSRWGRRRPFILATTPFVVTFLAAIPFAPEILKTANSIGWIAKLFSMGPAAPTILMFGLVVLGYQIFHYFIATVYYYLLPDVVPEEQIGRFYGLFRVFGNLSGMIFNYFLFSKAETHMKEIFVLIALIYGVFIMLMCWRVKEGEYPPLIDEPGKRWWDGIRNYGKECFAHSFYWLVYLVYASSICMTASGLFAVFFFRDEVHLSLEFIGKATALWSLCSLIVAYPCGYIVDRIGCHKALIFGNIALGFGWLLMFFLAQGPWTVLLLRIAVVVPFNLVGIAKMKWVVSVYPRDRYGQFSSAGAFVASVFSLFMGPLCGWLIDQAGCYRTIYLWNLFFSATTVIGAIIVFRRWKGLGGPDGFRAP